MNEDQFVAYSVDVLTAFKDFKKACIRLKELGMLSKYRQYELDLFIQRNNHYAKEFETAIARSKREWDD